MENVHEITAKEAKSDKQNNTDGGESRSGKEQMYQTGLVQGTELPERPGLEIPRVQATQSHFEFSMLLEGVVMISIEDARRLAAKGETAESVFGNMLVAVTTTVHDEVLEEWYPQKEIQLIIDFKPDFHIPCDRPVYRTDSKKERREIITRYLRDLKEISRAIKNLSTEIIPLVKGVLPRERKECYRCFEGLDFDRIGYYCAQYFLYGNHGEDLIQDVRQIVGEAQPRAMLLIGVQASSYLRRMPPEVTAAAGERWRRKSGLRNDSLSMQQVQRNYRDWSREIEKELEGGQSRLESFVTNTAEGSIHGN
ncbi:hypothetical protein [Halostagnicola kamekurae]|uniref:Uncharacterized protein n=1 Tax=Halostagnicola kamekurae TaxID=619731 RepID=A0A1I6US20_9EURY|nr:hypothetical protein [Halostagnicola kamekurae]SFT04259.1 hypothetical protein SAMN04488556_4037 [Halostagnicola kamekurae]